MPPQPGSEKNEVKNYSTMQLHMLFNIKNCNLQEVVSNEMIFKSILITLLKLANYGKAER